ncbi:MAG: DUF6171 family protein [Oscillospiraceae bacterium]|nr:DUF6171 family protein [Oscillospiraceae bacterium]
MRKECRCLLKELSDEDYFRNIYEYIALIPQEQKTPDGEYTARLENCKSCSNLTNGMCRLCGCFVETRAAKVHQYCPKGIW